MDPDQLASKPADVDLQFSIEIISGFILFSLRIYIWYQHSL